MRPRPAFCFIVDFVTGTWLGSQSSRQLDLSKVTPFHFVRKMVAEGRGSVTFLLLPCHQSLDYRIFFVESEAFRSVNTVQEIVRNWLDSGRVPAMCLSYNEIHMGIFYTSTGPMIGDFMKVYDGRRLLYLDSGGHINRLGPVRAVREIGTPLQLGKEPLARIQATIDNFNNRRRNSPSLQPGRNLRSTVPGMPSRVTTLNWEVLPMGFWRSWAASNSKDNAGMPIGPLSTEEIERLSFLDNLGPRAWYEGSHLGQRIYYVAVFDKVAVADCLEWGNALYYCAAQNDKWRQVFRLTKAEALRAGAKRLVHSGDWKQRLKEVVQYGDGLY